MIGETFGLELDNALKILAAGGLLCFPTETFYALGCLAENVAAVSAIYELKKRPQSKPLPLAAASISQAARYVDLDDLPVDLRSFWPGPLSILRKVLKPTKLAPQVINPFSEVAIRVSSHPTVAALAKLGLLTVSSANLADHLPVKRAQDLEHDFCLALEAQNLPFGIVTFFESQSCYTLPSTLIRYQSAKPRLLQILRGGAIGEHDFEVLGYQCEMG